MSKAVNEIDTLKEGMACRTAACLENHVVTVTIWLGLAYILAKNYGLDARTVYGSHIRVEVNCVGRWTVVDVAGRGCMVPVLGVYIEELERLISSAESEILT